MTAIISKEAIARRVYWVKEIANLSGSFTNDFDKLQAELEAEIRDGGVQVLVDHLRLCGSIPEVYAHDSSEEKLYSKYTDVILALVFANMGLKSVVLTERGDAADVDIFADDYAFVADAKAFRLSRTAKNAKDFKVSSMHLWKKGKDYAMVVCPIYQLPKKTSQIYQVATTSDVCIFTYSHLALLLRYATNAGNAAAQDLLLQIFKCVKSENPTKNAVDYWKPINRTILAHNSSIKELWDAEKQASLEAIDIAQKEDISLLTTMRKRIDGLSLDEAKKELIEVYNIDSKLASIQGVADNGLFQIGEENGGLFK